MFLYQTTCLKKNTLNLVKFSDVGQKSTIFCFITTILIAPRLVAIKQIQVIIK